MKWFKAKVEDGMQAIHDGGRLLMQRLLNVPGLAASGSCKAERLYPDGNYLVFPRRTRS